MATGKDGMNVIKSSRDEPEALYACVSEREHILIIVVGLSVILILSHIYILRMLLELLE